MDAKSESHPLNKNLTTVQRKSEREVVITRTFNAPARLVFEAWSQPELFKRWWVPQSVPMTLLSCEMEVRTGGKYRLVFEHPQAPEPLAFYGRYLEVTPPSRIVWTNEEGGADGAINTVTFEEKAGKTLLTLHELHPTKAALDEALASNLEAAMLQETYQQLDELLVTLTASSGPS